jgi:NAD(P)-dependent dehydrogenase (short-subunit alcohol dehydrogenase family)
MTGRIAVVTGASGGVGRALVRELSARGYDVGLLARGEAGLAGARHDVERTGCRAIECRVDVADFAAVDAAATRVEEELGPVDLWVNDAMTTVFSPFADLTADEFRRAVDVTFLGQVWGTKAALDRMRPRDRGHIVNVGSALAFLGIPLQSPYCASKFACRGFFESVRAELLHEGSQVKLSMVHLPAVNTPQFAWGRVHTKRRPMPVPPIYRPEVAARRIAEVACDGRRANVQGAWNRMLVVTGQLAPACANQFAAIAAWDSQLTDEPTRPDDAGNLDAPADAVHDFGARGRFGQQSGGFLDPSYLRTLPGTAVKFVRALIATVRE